MHTLAVKIHCFAEKFVAVKSKSQWKSKYAIKF